jgi:hypothetical protein
VCAEILSLGRVGCRSEYGLRFNMVCLGDGQSWFTGQGPITIRVRRESWGGVRWRGR